MSNPQVAIDITANDKSAKGIGSTEKHLKGLGSHTAKLGRDMGKIGERSGMRGLVRTIGEVDSAMSGAFGTRSAFGGIGSRARSVIGAASALRNGLGRTYPSLGRVAASSEEAASGIGAVAKIGATAVAELGSVEAAGAVAATGLGEATVAAGGLVAALGPIAVVGGAAVVTLGAAAAAGYKFASGWAAGTAQMGRFAETIGVASRDLQQLQGAAERYGVSKDATNGSLASFATISHDALYARNPEARALLTRLGVGFKKGADGNLDYDAMLSGVADAIQRQKDPQTRLMIANKLGLAPMLPALEKGGANLRSEKASFAHDGVVASDKDVANAKDFMRNSVILQQIGNKVDPVGDEAKAKTAAAGVPIMGKIIELGRGAEDGKLGSTVAKIGGDVTRSLGDTVRSLGASVAHLFVPAAEKLPPASTKMDRAGDKQLEAANRLGAPVRSIGAPRNALEMAGLIEHRGERSKQWQTSPVGARGVMQLMPETAKAVARRNGIPWDEHRFRTDENYNRHLGELEVGRLWEKFGHDPALVAAAYNAGDAVLDPGGYRDRKTGRHQQSWLTRYGDPRKGEVSDAEFASHIPFRETRAYVERILAALEAHLQTRPPAAPTPTTVEHTHRFEGLPKGVRVKSQTTGSPRLSYSFGHDY
jgi:hypothetical protein